MPALVFHFIDSRAGYPYFVSSPKIALRVYREKYNQINILCHQHWNTYIQSYLLLLETVFQILREIVTGREESQKIFYRDLYKATNKKRTLN